MIFFSSSLFDWYVYLLLSNYSRILFINHEEYQTLECVYVCLCSKSHDKCPNHKHLFNLSTFRSDFSFSSYVLGMLVTDAKKTEEEKENF